MNKSKNLALSAIAIACLTASQSFAQTTKKTTSSSTAPKKTAPAAPKPAQPALVLKTPGDSLSAAIGVSFSNSIMSQGIEGLNTDVLTKTITQALNGKPAAFGPEEANKFISEYFRKMQEEKGAVVRIEGEKFLEENKKKDSVKTTASGLQYKVIKMGTGPMPTATDKVKTHYHGTLIDGTVFDSSVQRGEPVEFPVNGVIKGWTEALQLMPVGSKWKLFIPYDLAYGERAAGPQIPAYSALVFEVELLEIVK